MAGAGWGPSAQGLEIMAGVSLPGSRPSLLYLFCFVLTLTFFKIFIRV